MSEKKQTYLLPESLIDQLDTFCVANGYERQRAVRAALRILVNGSPPELREMAMNARDKDIAAWFEAAKIALAHEQAKPLFEQILSRLGEIRGDEQPKAGHGKRR